MVGTPLPAPSLAGHTSIRQPPCSRTREPMGRACSRPKWTGRVAEGPSRLREKAGGTTRDNVAWPHARGRVSAYLAPNNLPPTLLNPNFCVASPPVGGARVGLAHARASPALLSVAWRRTQPLGIRQFYSPLHKYQYADKRDVEHKAREQHKGPFVSVQLVDAQPIVDA